MYEILDVLNLYDATVLKSFPNLSKFLEHFRTIPQIKSYLASERFVARPINGD